MEDLRARGSGYLTSEYLDQLNAHGQQSMGKDRELKWNKMKRVPPWSVRANLRTFVWAVI